MKSGALVAIIVLSVLLCSMPAASYELSLTGEAEWRYTYVSRTGPHDLFGNADLAQKRNANATSIGLSGAQAQAVRVEGFSSKGSDASWAEQRFFFFPEFRLNRAIRLRTHLAFQGNVNANYRGGGANWATNPHYSGWILMDSRDSYTGTGLAVPVVRAFWATVHTPMGILTIGTRPAIFGMGTLVHEQDSYARSMALITPYGPFTFVVSQYLHDPGLQRTDPNDDRNARKTPLTINSALDQNQTYGWNTSVATRFQQGPLDCGALFYLLSRDGHKWLGQPSGTYQDDRMASGVIQILTMWPAYGTGGALPAMPIVGGDCRIYTGIAYVKYLHERLFLNAEYDFIKLDTVRNGGRPIYGYAQAWGVELGVFSGPAKVTLAHFYRSGHDRRGGSFNLASPLGAAPYPGGTVFVSDRLDHFLALFLGGGDSPLRPYNYLMGLYGTGNNSFTSTGVPTYEDFLCYAARVDYAVAANVNLFGTFMKAERASNTSTPVGFYNGSWAQGWPDPADQSNSPGAGTFYGFGGIFPWTGSSPFPFGAYSTGPPVPNVPDNDLGWEANAGFEWKLLENMTWKFRLAFWKPGAWFAWAYQDLTSSVESHNPVPDGRLNGRLQGSVSPNRAISPLFALQSSLLFEF